MINALFGDRVPCSSTKHLTGHTLGAAGITEAALSWLILTRDLPLPPIFPLRAGRHAAALRPAASACAADKTGDFIELIRLWR